MQSLGNIKALMGETFIGGAKKKGPVKKTAAKKYKKGGSEATTEGTWNCSSCKFVPAVSQQPPISDSFKPELVDAAVKDDLSIQTASKDEPNVMDGGRGSVKAEYKKQLAKKTVAELKEMAVSRGVKTTKKIDGKTVPIKKDTLVKKLCAYKHGK